MNKVLSQAIKKAVSEFTPRVVSDNKEKGPDLFSLNSNTELFQNSKGITIKIDRTRDANLTDFGKATYFKKRSSNFGDVIVVMKNFFEALMPPILLKFIYKYIFRYIKKS